MTGFLKQTNGYALDWCKFLLGFSKDCYFRCKHRFLYLGLIRLFSANFVEYWVVGIMNFRKFLKDIDMSDETTMFEGFKDGCCVGENCGVGIEMCVGSDEEKELIRKRKRECYLPLLDWVKRLAKDPCDPAIGSMPGSSKWKAYGSEHVWKQALLAKEVMVLKVNDDSNADQSVWKKKRKMHPDMYSDQPKNINSRCSQRLVSIKETQSTLLTRKLHFQDYSDSSSTESQSDVENEGYFLFYQAEIPEWAPETYKCETKWLGTRVWPLEETVKRRSLIERETIGKGRQSSCGCEFEGSLECVRFHISEKRYRVRLELGPAFANWKFDTMGEEVSLNWTIHEEKMFVELIKLNPESSGRSFWYELMTHFKNKSKAILVSYYFNVYLLRRRAHQNRTDPSNVDSDDDELEKVEGSILCSPKVHLKFA